MAISKHNSNSTHKLSCITISSPSFSSSNLQTLLLSPKKSTKHTTKLSHKHYFLLFLFLLSLIGMLKLGFNLDPFTPNPCFISPPFQPQTSIPSVSAASASNLLASEFVRREVEEDDEFWNCPFSMKVIDYFSTGQNGRWTNSIANFVNVWKPLGATEQGKRVNSSIPLIIIWVLWQERNARCFDEKGTRGRG